jgi:hypothetical protein
VKTTSLFKILALTAFAALTQSGSTALTLHERLRLSNTFKTPEEVVRYYCARDASGFVWSGLLDKERTEFTLWNQLPETESFYVAQKYDIVPLPGATRDSAKIQVRYKILGMSDTYGSLVPAERPDYSVTFTLKRVGAQWKIALPAPPQLAPVVVEGKFPLVSSNSH